ERSSDRGPPMKLLVTGGAGFARGASTRSCTSRRRATSTAASRTPRCFCVQTLAGSSFKANYFVIETREEYWISGPRRDGADRLYGERVPVEIDDDVREEYWVNIRKLPERKRESRTW